MPTGLKWRDETPLTFEQVEYRKMVYKQISADDESFDMGSWEWSPETLGHALRLLPEFNNCRTTRCVAGWAQFYAKGAVREPTVEQDAIDAMGLSWLDYRGTDPAKVGLFRTNADDALARMKVLAEAVPG